MFILILILNLFFFCAAVTPFVFTIFKAVKFSNEEIHGRLFVKLFLQGLLIGVISIIVISVLFLLMNWSRVSIEFAAQNSFMLLGYFLILILFNFSTYLFVATSSKLIVAIPIFLLSATIGYYINLTGILNGPIKEVKSSLRGETNIPPLSPDIAERCVQNEQVLFFAYVFKPSKEMLECYKERDKFSNECYNCPDSYNYCDFISVTDKDGKILCNGNLPDCKKYVTSLKYCQLWQTNDVNTGKWVDVSKFSLGDLYNGRSNPN